MAPAPEAKPFLKWVGGKRQLLPVLRTYYPGPTSNFRQYTARGFSDQDQARLQALAVGLAGRGVHVLLSNSSADSIVRLYGERTARSAGLTIRRVPARRAVNTRADRRGPVDELLVSNLPPVA